jgi:ferritin-like metal-binding protein YciE
MDDDKELQLLEVENQIEKRKKELQEQFERLNTGFDDILERIRKRKADKINNT